MMGTAVMAQPAEPTVSVVELPRGADAQAPSCWLIAGIVIELSAAATTGAPNRALRAIAPASVAARRRGVRLGNLTDRKPRMDGQTSAAHLAASLRRKQTPSLTRRRRAGQVPNVSATPRGKAGRTWLPERACYGFWTLSPNRYSGLVKN